MNFNSIATAAAAPGSSSFEIRRCPDQYVGVLEAIKALGDFPVRHPALARPSGPAVILILESPHIDEFVGQMGPAMGPTGKNIARYVRLVPGLDAMGALPLILVNAVQYQCSLGQKTERYRDKVFLAVWKEGGREDFAQRMRQTYRPSDTVVCACTKGNLGKCELRRLVHATLVGEFPLANVLRRTHPAKWNIPKLRNYEWI
jgi:hypothetical protein